MNRRALRYELSGWSCKPFVSWCLIYQWTGHWSASKWLSCVSTIPTLHCFPSGFHCHPQVRADFASRWAVMCGYLIFTLFSPCYIIGNAHHTSEEAFSMSIMSTPKQVLQIWYITTPCKSPRVPDCRYDNPWLQSKLAKSHIYAQLVSNCTCSELVYKWTRWTIPSVHIRHFNPGSKLLVLVLYQAFNSSHWFETHARTNHLILDFLGKTRRPYLPPLLPPALLLPHHMLLPHASYLLTGKYFSHNQLPTTIQSQGSLTKV